MSKSPMFFIELHRILKQDGFVAFEVGEIQGGRLKLEDIVIPAAERAALKPILSSHQSARGYENLELLGRK